MFDTLLAHSPNATFVVTLVDLEAPLDATSAVAGRGLFPDFGFCLPHCLAIRGSQPRGLYLS